MIELAVLLVSMLPASGLLQLFTGTTFTSLTSALLSSNSSSLQVSFLDSETYQLSTFGWHQSLTLICMNNTVIVTASLLVPSEMWVNLTQCQVTSQMTAGAVLSVFGEVVLEGGGMFAISVPVFLLYGSLTLRDSRFVYNFKSLFTASLFGFSLLISNCVFEDNTSGAGTILLLSLFGSGTSSFTNITILQSQFRRNSAALGGSFLYLNVNNALNLSASQLLQSRTMTVANSSFETNPGIMCLITSNSFLESVFRNNSFTGAQTVFIIKQLSADLTLHASYFNVRDFLVLVSALFAQLTVSEVTVEGIILGPALMIPNKANIELGLVRVSGLTIRKSTYSPKTFGSTTLLAINAAVQADHITIEDTTASVGLAGTYSFSAATVRDVYARNVTFQGMVVFGFFSQVDSANLYVGNVTMTIGGFYGCYYSNSRMRNLTTDVGVAGYYLSKPTPRYNIIIAYSANVTLLDCHFVVPRIANYPALYLWRSSIFTQNLNFTAMYANLINLFDHSNGTVLNVRIGDFKAQSMTLVFQSVLRLDAVTIEQGQIKTSAIAAINQAQVYASNFTLCQGTFESLVSASQSKLILTNFTLPALSADTLFEYITHSYIEANQIAFSNSAFDLTQLISSQLILRSVAMYNIHIRRRFMILVQSNLTFENCSLQNLSAVTETPLCRASKDSTLSLLSTHFAGLWTLEQDLMRFSRSTLLLHSSSLAQYNGTFFTGDLSKVSIESCEIRDGGLVRRAFGENTSGFLDCSACSVTLSNSRFKKISGTSGGVASLISSNLFVEACQFVSGTVFEDGSFINAINTNVTIEFSRFERGQAARGGALFAGCESATACQCLISATNFSWNSAREGGAIRWTKMRPSYSSVEAANNSALYGSFEASLPIHMSLIAANQAVIYGVAGVHVIQPILVGFFDAIEQLVKTDESSTAELKSEQIIGTTSVLAKGGVANFSSIILQTTPGRTVPIQVQSKSINQTFPGSPKAFYSFTYVTRLCVPGEVTSNVGCYLCPKNTFSVDPSDSQCKECPSYASCPGGKTLVLSPGYWRESDLSAEVFNCPIENACEGGDNATCAEGYEGLLCSVCSQGYYSIGLRYCELCEVLFARVIRAVLICIAATGMYLTLIAIPSEIVAASLKLIVELFQTLLILPSLNVNWGPLLMGYFSFNEMLMSFGLSALTFDCLLDRDSFLPFVFIRAIAAVAFQLLVLAVIAGLCCCVKSRSAFLPRYIRCSLAFMWVYYSYMVKATLSLVPCKQVNNDWHLAADVSVSCYASEQRPLLAITLPLVILSVCPFPLLLWTALRRSDMDRRMYVPLYLLSYYDPKYLFAALRGVLCRIMLFTLLFGLSFADNTVQILCSSSALYLYLHLHFAIPQSTSRFLVIAEGTSLLVQTYLCACSLYFAVELDVNPAVRTVLSCLLLLLVVLIAVGTCVGSVKLHKVIIRSQMVYPYTTDHQSEVGVLATPPPSLVSAQSLSVDSFCNSYSEQASAVVG